MVAQLDRVSDYESEGRGFESLPAHDIKAGSVAEPQDPAFISCKKLGLEQPVPAVKRAEARRSHIFAGGRRFF